MPVRPWDDETEPGINPSTGHEGGGWVECLDCGGSGRKTENGTNGIRVWFCVPCPICDGTGMVKDEGQDS